MMKKKYKIIIAVIIILLAIYALFWHPYQPFTVDKIGKINSCKGCVCLGTLTVMESFPEQYICNGIHTCIDKDTSKCS